MANKPEGFGLGADAPHEAKVQHVLANSKKDDGDHLCHGGMPGCKKTCPPAMWGCRSCWYRLPPKLRHKIWKAYRPGQETDKRPSREYLQVAREVEEWIAQKYPKEKK